MAAENLLPVLLDKANAFKIFPMVFSAVILVASLKTVVEAVDASNWALFMLATAETIAVVLFVYPKFTKVSGLVLMAIFLLAIILSLVSGVIMSQLHLIVYLVCTYLILVLNTHGLTGKE